MILLKGWEDIKYFSITLPAQFMAEATHGSSCDEKLMETL